MGVKKKDYFAQFYSRSPSQSHFVSPRLLLLPAPSLSLFSSMRLEKRLKNAITLALMCNTFQISPPLGWVNWDKLLSSSLSSSFFFFFFYLRRDEDTQLRGAALGDEEQGDATHRFPFTPFSPPRYQVLPSSSLFCDQRLPLRLRWPFATF